MSESPRLPLARLADGFTCPVCDRMVLNQRPRDGWGWYACARRPCAAHWLDIALPPGTSASDLVARYGAEATALVTALLPSLTQAMLADTGCLVATDALRAAHLQLQAPPKVAYRWSGTRAPLAETLRALCGLTAASSRTGAA